jgi:TM2 domain-containing membrane protein YozV
MMKRLLVALLVVAANSFTHALFAETGLDFGTYLFRTGNYGASILELERYIFYHPDGSAGSRSQAALLLALSYAHEDRYNKALFLLQGISPDDEEMLFCEAQFHKLNILFRQKKTGDFQLQRERIESLCPSLDARLNSYIDEMSVALSIYDMNWSIALKEVGHSERLSADIKSTFTRDLNDIIAYDPRSPVLGGFLSLIPGLGHFYAGRAVDGFKSLLINGTFVSLTVFSFLEGYDGLGVAFGIVEGVLYVTNIYGGVNAVMQENARYVIERRDRMLKRIDAPPLTVISIREEFGF